MAQSREKDGVRTWREGPVARIAMTRPDKANAQDAAMLYALNQAFDDAVADSDAKVVVLSGDGDNFCAGHDLNDLGRVDTPAGYAPVTSTEQWTAAGAAGWMAYEEDAFLGLHRRWRNLPIPTIAMVHGWAVAGGLMTAWVCDLIIASDDAKFADPVVGMGINGHEWFVHAWELGARRAKELLFTAGHLTAEQALDAGMVNHVVHGSGLESFTMTLASKIAAQDPFALKLAKRCVNHSLDAQGQTQAVDYAFAAHHLAHTHHRALTGAIVSRAWLDATERT